ncbi:MAG: hypothetical protein ACK5JD_12010 [Mangrovibacterium sp.]
MEDFTQSEEKLFRLASVRSDLRDAAKWAKFLSIVGFVMIGILVVICIGVMLAGSALSQFADTPMPFGLLGIIYLLIAALYFFPVYYLYNFAKATIYGIDGADENQLARGMANLRRLFKFMGILTIIVLAIYAIALVIVVPMIFWMGN